VQGAPAKISFGYAFKIMRNMVLERPGDVGDEHAINRAEIIEGMLLARSSQPSST
jgi:hypothetical protein